MFNLNKLGKLSIFLQIYILLVSEKEKDIIMMENFKFNQ